MNLFRFRITLYDPLFYAREGLSAALTPKILHATAINHAVCAARGDHVVNQPFVIADKNGGMDTPRYEDSCISEQFYFSPASIVGTANDWPEIVKGDNEGFFFKVKAGEILKATRLLFIAPETQFVGLGVAKAKSIEFPARIRLGSFRGVARLETESANKFKSLASDTSHSVDHPVDPLVSVVDRGVMHNMFPYPLVENPMCKNVYEASFEWPLFGRKKARFAWPRGIDEPRKLDRIKTGPSAIM